MKKEKEISREIITAKIKEERKSQDATNSIKKNRKIRVKKRKLKFKKLQTMLQKKQKKLQPKKKAALF